MALMTKQGIVLSNDNGNVKVMIQRNEACGSCASKDSCTQKQDTIVEVYSTEDISTGDRIVLTTNSSDITKFSLYVYVLPVLMMILGAAVPNILLKNTTYDMNLLTLISSIIFLLISYLIAKGLDKKVRGQNVMRVRKV